MKSAYRWVLVLCLVAIAIALPGAIARMCGASIGLLASIAVFQLFAVMAFFATSLGSLALGIRAALDKEWKALVFYLGAATIPAAALGLAEFANAPGWEAVMGI
ncbi:MAG TPA: hypothetical protein PLU52_05955 [Opitutaceae bacterium]|nr:hypothetical protein [Opitutaceae bacterium]